MMNEWLKAQAQKKQITEADVQRKRLGIELNETKKPKGGVSGELAGKFMSDVINGIIKQGKKEKLSPEEIKKRVEKEKRELSSEDQNDRQ